MAVTPPDEQARQWKAHEAAELAERRCPDSGMPLAETVTAWGNRALMCGPCDCFGYPLDDPAIGVAAPTPPLAAADREDRTR